MIHIETVEYDVELLTEDGTRYLINNALLSLQWEEQKNELAQRATLTVANMKIDDKWLITLAKINCAILIYGKWEKKEKQLLFEGTIWEWQYNSNTQKELTITAYDKLVRLQQSKDFRYYSPGMTTKAIIEDICQGKDSKQPGWNIPYTYKWEQSITHEKKVFSANTISDMIISLLEEVRQKTGAKYVIYWRDNQLQIVDYGINEPVYKFSGKNTVSTSNKLTINRLVTRVKIIGKQAKSKRAPVDAIVDGDMQYGVLQEIVRRDSDKKLKTAMDEANAIIKDRGKPEEIIQASVPDLPFVRKGDKVEMEAGNLIGFFYIEGVSHIAEARRMMLTLARIE